MKLFYVLNSTCDVVDQALFSVVSLNWNLDQVVN